jgi:hypothetical protein
VLHRAAAARAAAARAAAAALAAAALAAGCHRRAPGAEAADRSWRAHERAIAAGERARTCAEAGVAMTLVIAAHRQDFIDGLAIDREPDRLAEATSFIAASEARYRDLETRMIALADRCADDAVVRGAFERMESP